MGKKVIMINGSFRKHNTYNVLVQTGELLKKYGIETEILNLSDYEIKHCIGDDENCIRNGKCSQKDDMQTLMQKIMDSDGVVLGSPVYLNGASSRFKAFADRTNKWFHAPETVGKPVLFAVTTATTGIRETVRFMENLTTGYGMRKGGSVTRTMKTIKTPIDEKELARFISLLEKDKKYYRPSMNEIVIFQVQKVLANKSNGYDREFWEEKKWPDKNYYYDCKMGPGKILFSKMMNRILTGAMK